MAGDVGRIRVCQSGTCRSRGSDAVVAEIEELASLVGGCDVGTTSCLGYCRRGPAVRVVRGSRIRVHARVDTLGKSAAVVEDATGREPPPPERLPPEAESRLEATRATRRRGHLVSNYRWNAALSDATESTIWREDLRLVFKRILSNAGYRISLRDLVKSPRALGMPKSIRHYSRWTLRSVEVVSENSAIYSFETDDPGRGTPHPRDRRDRIGADPITWHVTMLGEVGANGEGPLPWIERDYTPISTALEWERGRCDVLVKVYRDGALTQWLRATTAWLGPETRVWLSRPLRTLSVPSLIADDDDGSRPGSVLLLLAGTGIVALPQILAHRDPIRSLGIPTPRYKQLGCPIDLIQSCRENDVLLLPRIKQYCLEGTAPGPKFQGVRNYTLLLTGEMGGEGAEAAPFHGHFNEKNTMDYDSAFGNVPNAKVIKSRMDGSIIANAIDRLTYPYRVVVSGPGAFNNAARSFLDGCGVDSTQITILSA